MGERRDGERSRPLILPVTSHLGFDSSPQQVSMKARAPIPGNQGGRSIIGHGCSNEIYLFVDRFIVYTLYCKPGQLTITDFFCTEIDNGSLPGRCQVTTKADREVTG